VDSCDGAAVIAESEDSSKRSKRKKQLTPFELSEIIVEKGIKSRTELLAFANMQKMEGKHDIAEFVVNREPRIFSEILHTAWEMKTAQDKLDRSKKIHKENAFLVVRENGIPVHLKY